MADTAPAPPAASTSSSTAGTASSARNSLKRARVLFDATSNAKRALIPPVDRSIHKLSVARRVRANYPVIPSDAVGAVGDESGGGGGAAGSKSRGGSSSLTAQVLAELRQETARRIVSGEAGTDAASTSAAGGVGEGQIILHREVDLGGTAGAVGAFGNAAAGGVLALPGQKIQAVDDKAEDSGKTVRPGGILVVSLYIYLNMDYILSMIDC